MKQTSCLLLESPVTERTPSLHDQRLQTVLSVIRDTGAKRVVDLGCGEGKLLKLLLSREAVRDHPRHGCVLANAGDREGALATG